MDMENDVRGLLYEVLYLVLTKRIQIGYIDIFEEGIAVSVEMISEACDGCGKETRGFAFRLYSDGVTASELSSTFFTVLLSEGFTLQESCFVFINVDSGRDLEGTIGLFFLVF